MVGNTPVLTVAPRYNTAYLQDLLGADTYKQYKEAGTIKEYGTEASIQVNTPYNISANDAHKFDRKVPAKYYSPQGSDAALLGTFEKHAGTAQINSEAQNQKDRSVSIGDKITSFKYTDNDVKTELITYVNKMDKQLQILNRSDISIEQKGKATIELLKLNNLAEAKFKSLTQ